MSDAVANEDHEEERLPLMIVVVSKVEEEFYVVGDVVTVDGEERCRGGCRRGRWSGGGEERGEARSRRCGGVR